MCGIAGILNFNDKPLNQHLIKQMTDSLIHRGPDGEGIWISKNKNIGLGHRRLSIIDLSNAATQPMSYAQERFHITFNGEIYNYIELRNDLEKKGFNFFSDSDTEVLLAMYAAYGEKCLEFLDGMFAFAIWDEKEQELFCARDRFGEKPFYYYQDNDCFVFASEIKALWKAGIEKRLNPEKVYKYLMYNSLQTSTTSEETFYTSIKTLEQAHFVRLNTKGKWLKKRYWKVSLATQNNGLTIKQASERFFELFLNSVNLRLRSDVSVGSSLSGGLDSSAIVVMIQKTPNKSNTFHTFSARFKGFDKDEGKYIEALLKQYESVMSKQVFPSEDSMEKNFNKIVYHQDEPFNSLSISAQFEVYELAKSSGVTVLLDGQGADEYLAGYRSFHETYLRQLYFSNRVLYNKELNAFKMLKGENYQINNGADRIKHNNPAFFNLVAKSRRKLLSPTNPYFLGVHPDLVKKFRSLENPILNPKSMKEHLFDASFNSGLVNLLRYADRNSMANSLEVRLPFLSHELVEFAFSLPDNFLIHEGWSKYILRKSMESLLPNNICWRKDKIGFATPQNDFLNSEFFSEKKIQAVELLKSSGLISKHIPSLDWTYIMLSEYLN